ncbi:hypothetical protein SB749_15070 [Brevibacterium sp. SIMBA_078]|uniref:hypothetical protein n=1 Tax=Brevibacterium sp. SIMBA_078 TaxID=3085816 RepID=UPI0039781304
MTHHHLGARSPPPDQESGRQAANDKGQDRAGEAREHDDNEREVISMSSDKRFSALRSRAEEIAAQKKALDDAEKAYNKSIDEAVKHAGRARAEFVEKLYKYFGIEAETTLRRDKHGEVVRDKDGRPVEVKTDRNEAVRIQKLAEAFAQLVDGQDDAQDAEPITDRPDSDDEDNAPVSTVSTPDPQASCGHRFDENVA